MAKPENCPYCGSNNTKRISYLSCICKDCDEEFESFKDAWPDIEKESDPEIRDILGLTLADDYDYRFKHQKLTEVEELDLNEEEWQLYWYGEGEN